MGDSITLKVVSVFFHRPDSTEYLRKTLTPLLSDLLQQDLFVTEGESSLRSMFKRSNSNESLPSSVLSKQSSQSYVLTPSNASIASLDDDGQKKRTASFGSFSDLAAKATEKKRQSFSAIKRTLRKSDKAALDMSERWFPFRPNGTFLMSDCCCCCSF